MRNISPPGGFWMIIKAMKSLTGLVSILLVCLLGSMVYIFSSRSNETTIESGADAPLVQVRKISVPRKFKLSGELQPKTQVDVVSRLAGKLIEVRFQVGDFVPPGALVAAVHADDLDRRLARLEGNVEAAKQALRPTEDELANAEKSLSRHREFLRGDLIARRDVEQAEIEVETARAKAELARAQLAQQEAMLSQVRGLQGLTRLYAPTGGQVIKRLLEPGAMVGEGTAVLSVASLDALTINLTLSGDPLSELRPAMDVQITTAELPGVIAEGKVIRIEPQKRDDSKSSEIEIEVVNQNRKLRPGMAVEALVDLQTAGEFLSVPRSAIETDGQRTYVYKIADGRALRQQVVLGSEHGDERAVVKGLREGEWIAADPKKVKSAIPVGSVSSQSVPKHGK